MISEHNKLVLIKEGSLSGENRLEFVEIIIVGYSTNVYKQVYKFISNTRRYVP